MAVSRAEIERLRTEADTIFTRIDAVETALERARTESGDHWESGELTLTLETPAGESIDVTLDLEASAAENAQRRYERAGTLEAELEEREAVAGELDAELTAIDGTCEELASSGLVAVDSAGDGGVTDYRLSETGEQLLAHLEKREGRVDFLRWLEDAATLARRLWRGGPDYPQLTAVEVGLDLGHVRQLYRAMEAVRLVETYDGSIIKGTERKLKPKTETHRKHTYYVSNPRLKSWACQWTPLLPSI
ncbi:DUF2250 domain-containing protein [Natronobeatus ordinarius]|uniref:DUF2250 domain-containing protein n=1 Tax=Natronobeatus ordinarius TaxID=2963433 RepID=UPI0020CCCF95|nr:DUF2250 domain-containing protein [Natronobeatus ordinarius]